MHVVVVQWQNYRHTKCQIYSIPTAERRIPAEILSTIFVQCLPERWQKRSSHYTHTKAVPVLLGQVCSYWWHVAIHELRLWNSFTVVMQENDSKCVAEMARTWLLRAGDLPLSLLILARDGGIEVSAQAVTDILVSHCDGWQHVCRPKASTVLLL
jgi:hypothetical protein